MSVDLVGVNYSKNFIDKLPGKIEFTILGKNTETGVQTTSLGNLDANYKSHGVGFQKLQEELPSGQVNEITKKSITVYGITFERTNSSDGSWSNEFKFSESFYRSFFVGIRAEGSLSIYKERYKPNK